MVRIYDVTLPINKIPHITGRNQKRTEINSGVTILRNYPRVRIYVQVD